jgi:hypothetical protein
MYMLMPDEPHTGFVTLAVIFVSATLLGFASHAPGGIGVFDATMLIALWQFDREDVLAGLLLFRLIYYVVPFAAALTVLGVRELLVNVGATRRRTVVAPAPAADAVPAAIEQEHKAPRPWSPPAAAPAAERDSAPPRQRQGGSG